MTVAVDLGTTHTGEPAELDLEELLSTRLLVQGNSGSGKSHLLRRLLEKSAGWVQQAIIDPEGDFVTLADRYGHVVVDANRTPNDLARIANRIRQHRASVVLTLEGLDADVQMQCAAAFLNGLFEADRSHWFPMLIAVDEAHLFAPAMAGEHSEEARRASLGAMTNLMCRGRKRGLAGVIATQRLAKLAKNVAAEASNFLMGRTFLDIDMQRAADLIGIDRRGAERFRDLETGNFIALGPALFRRPIPIRIGAVETAARSGRPTLMPLPDVSPDALADLVLTAPEPERSPERGSVRHSEMPPWQSVSACEPPRVETSELLSQVISSGPANDPGSPVDEDPRTPEERAEAVDRIFAEMLDDPDAAFRPVPVLYQEFLTHCRLKRLRGAETDMGAFRRRLSLARAGIAGDETDDEWADVVAVSAELPEEMQGVFMMLARAARDEAESPSDVMLAKAYGSHSPSRGRFLLSFMEDRGLIGVEKDFRGNRVVMIAATGWRTKLPEVTLDSIDEARARRAARMARKA
ncbi:Proline-rich region:ATP/GTP-binding site motif A (P-loop) [Fulvimarina pelagi HTCC2506]|uniref:Proline-rich region:ATP/GTP-binding site motif A (P-loop) n=1 Tax=Fulvimarina pelagi HTCC2506 TaxID=314231 RepID=Q0G5I4_9HYPH|nr:ATP-binding protein [Fulvimarina pelagi]EAU43080.1 Proline-rich region:ATP/GTP-binding site motif A (P-loop) [Fulvimarina pelagi HTCC2506]